MHHKIIITINFVAMAFSMASVLTFTWFSSYAGGLYVQISTTLLTASILIALSFKKTRQVFELHRIQSVGVWVSIPLALLVGILIDIPRTSGIADACLASFADYFLSDGWFCCICLLLDY